MSTSRRRASKPRISRGWAALDSPTPGDVLKCLDELGITVTKVVREEAHALCPGHEMRTGHADRNPSWSCNTDTGLHGCWSCGYTGNFAQLVEHVLDVDAATAASWIRARGALDYIKRQLAAPVARQRPQVNDAALALFTEPPPEALASRLLDGDACAQYGVLWDPGRDMWILPIREGGGQLLGWQEKNAKWFRNKPDSVPKSRTLFGFDTLPVGGTAVLVESPLDAPRLLTCGIVGGVSSYGVRVSDAQLDLIVERAGDLVLALDNDRDGRALTYELLERLAGRLRTRVWNYDGCEAKDPGEQTADEITHSYRSAVGGLAYLLRRGHADHPALRLPKRAAGQIPGPGEPAAGRRHGHRKNHHGNRGG